MVRCFFMLLFCSFSVTAQISWKIVNIDFLFSLELPEGFSEKGESFEKEYEAKGEYGRFTVIKARHADAQTTTTKDLHDFYRNFRLSYIPSADDLLYEDYDVKINGLDGYRFVYKTASDETPIGDMIVVLIKDICYSFEYVYNDTDTEAANQEIEHFYKSIYLKAVNSSEQFTEVQTGKEIVGEKIGYALRYLVIVMLVIVFILIVFRNLKFIQRIKITASVFFILSGGINLVLYTINKLRSEDHRLMFFLGFLYLIFGIILLIVKLPKSELEES